ncbi:hypothetical protein IMZ48_16395 [Candidatus Bathyarchaeota archaeon]|nr:hypothetical protein [Candidatus Bathyarchaeota archaeon]
MASPASVRPSLDADPDGYNARRDDLTLKGLIKMLSRSKEENRKMLGEVSIKEYVTEY